MNLAIKRRMALILLFATLFTLLAGCTTPTTSTDPTITDPTTATEPTFVGQPATAQDVFNGMTDFVAVPFVRANINWAYSLDVRVIADNPGFVITLDSPMYVLVEDEEVTEGIIEQLKNCKKCYLLKTTGENISYGEKIAVYDIEGSLYFIRIEGVNSVWMIHCFQNTMGG